MANSRVLLMVCLAALAGSIQGIYSPVGGPWRDDPRGGISHPIFIKRDVPEAVQDLVNKIENLVSDYQKGATTIKILEESFQDISDEAQDILDKADVKVTDKDVLSFAGDIAGSFLHMLAKYPLDETPALDFAVNMLVDIVERVDEDPAKIYIAVRAIEETADVIHKILSGITGVFDYIGLPLGKRQTKVKGHYNHGPEGTSYGGSIEHTWGKRLIKRQTKVKGHYNHGPEGTSYGGSIEHTWGKRLQKRQDKESESTAKAHFNNGPDGPSGGASIYHRFGNGVYTGGQFDYSKQGAGGEAYVGKEWKNGIKVNGYVGHNPSEGFNTGVGVTIPLGRKKGRKGKKLF